MGRDSEASHADTNVHKQQSSSGVLKALNYVSTPHGPDQQRGLRFLDRLLQQCVLGYDNFS